MVPFTRIIGLAAAGVLIAFTAVGTPAHADKSSKSAALPQASVFTDCQVLRRAISRRACQARLWREEQVDTAENK